MTEAEWLACDDPAAMLEFLDGKVSERKVRLFACACCRRIWHLLTDQRSRHAIEAAELYANGLAGVEDLRAARLASKAAHTPQIRTALAVGADSATLSDADFKPYFTNWALAHASKAAWDTTRARPAAATGRSLIAAVVGANSLTEEAGGEVERQARKSMQFAQTEIARDIVGSPFWPVTGDPSWQTAAVVSLATAIYVDRAFERLPILADALEDAGCTNRDILGHCRQPGEHVRGCWVVDLVLGRK